MSLKKIALTLQNKSDISGHAGSCKHFLIYTIFDKVIVDKNILVLQEAQTLHNTFHSAIPQDQHPIFETDILITTGIGMGAINRLKAKQVEVIIVNETNPDDVIKQWLAGTLQSVDLETLQASGACNCGHHKH